MTKDELAQWAMANGWREIGGHLSLTKPSRPDEPIVRLLLKGTVVHLEIKKPIGKWEKVIGVPYSAIDPDPDSGIPKGLGFDTISGFSALIEDNKNRAVFARLNARPKADD